MVIRSAAKRPGRVRLSFPEGEGRTRQSMADECDINKILASYQVTGAISHFAQNSGRYDFADSIELHGALNIVKEADRMFADLPSSLRRRFETAGAFLDFVQDPDNGEAMRELGLRDPVTPQETPEARTGESPPVGEWPTEEVSPAAAAAEFASE